MTLLLRYCRVGPPWATGFSGLVDGAGVVEAAGGVETDGAKGVAIDEG